jgi:hypothetical protein
VTLTTNHEGLFMELFWLVRFGRPRLFIPWSDFHNPTLNTFFFWRNVKADIGNPAITTIRLPPVVYAQSEGHDRAATP